MEKIKPREDLPNLIGNLARTLTYNFGAEDKVPGSIRASDWVEAKFQGENGNFCVTEEAVLKDAPIGEAIFTIRRQTDQENTVITTIQRKSPSNNGHKNHFDLSRFPVTVKDNQGENLKPEDVYDLLLSMKQAIKRELLPIPVKKQNSEVIKG